ncbi:MAG: hypothetical protein QOH04_2833 [Sphingomonadales bacterium]|jgi:hypothetical protein|nr:hypothetical protein [Sphingomonadales bacterium]
MGRPVRVTIRGPEDERIDAPTAARALECDDDPERFRERVGKLVKHKPVEKPE